MPALIRIAVAALVREGRILMVHRHPERRWYPDCWDLVGGHVEAGETAEEAVVRECLEEVGVRVLDPRRTPMRFSDPTIELHAFVVHHWAGEPANLAPDEHDAMGWFSSEELAGLTLADAESLPDLQRLVRASRDFRAPR